MADERPAELRSQAPSHGWVHRYPPLFTFIAALLIMFLVMPSALNLPQANPSTVLEYAPVPPEDDEPPPPQDGSFSSLGLGTSDTLSRDTGPGGTDLPDDSRDVTSEKPRTNRCVGDPPRQTEDPNSPPCVPFFEGENGGATYQGVTGNEITVLLYASGFQSVAGDRGYERTPPTATYCDVDAEPHSQPECLEGQQRNEDHSLVQVTRALSRYFNDRFEAYNRHVHFWIFWSSGSQTPSTRRSDAQDNWETLRPFAVIDYAFFGGHNAVYAEAMTKRKVSVYGNFSALANSFYRENAPFIWSFWPDVERWADMYTSYVCERVAPFPVTHSGMSADNGQERRYGLLSTNDPGFQGLRYFARLTTERFEQGCPNGQKLDIADTYTFPRHQWAADTHPDAISKARENIAKMVADGVTTVLWLGGYETEHTKAAKEAEFYPEWMVAGDLLNDTNTTARYQDQDVWRHAWHMTNHLREDRSADAPCRMAYREVEPFGLGDDEDVACELYRAFFMLFRGIQVAGPFLTPEAVDQGNHAISRQLSNNPYLASCFFETGDYTCVKDAQEAWWDPDAPDPDGDPEERGCWRMVDEGQRYITGTWPQEDKVFANPSDVCNNVTGAEFVNPFGPAG